MLPISPSGFELLGCVWYIGIRIDNKKSLSILISHGMKSII